MPFPTSRFVRQAKYRLLQARPIGIGGVGRVYYAYDVALRRAVAVKEVVHDLEQEEFSRAQLRLRREARMHLSLDHPNIVKCHAFEYEPASDEGYLVCDFIAGGSLASYLRRHPIEEKEALQIAIDLLAALDYLHQHEIVHRDIKPSNILIDTSTGKIKALLTDFGIARRTGEPVVNPRNPNDLPALTPEYSAPEQNKIEQPPDKRSDLFGIGLLLGEMLSGGEPYKLRLRAARQELGRAVQHLDIAPKTSRALASVIDRACQARPDKRYQSARDFSRALKRIQRRQALKELFQLPFSLIGASASLLVLLVAAVLALSGQLMPPEQAPSNQAHLVQVQATARPSPTVLAPSPAPSATSVLPNLQLASTPTPSTQPSLQPSASPSLPPIELPSDELELAKQAEQTQPTSSPEALYFHAPPSPAPISSKTAKPTQQPTQEILIPEASPEQPDLTNVPW